MKKNHLQLIPLALAVLLVGCVQTAQNPREIVFIKSEQSLGDTRTFGLAIAGLFEHRRSKLDT